MITQPPTPTVTRPALTALEQSPVALATRVGGSTAGELLPRQVQIGLDGSGLLADRTLVPLGPAAHNWLEGPDGPSVTRVLRGFLGSLDGRSAATHLKGLSFADSTDGFALNSLVSWTEHGYVALPATSEQVPAWQAGVDSAIKLSWQATDGAQALETWMNVGPGITSTIRDLAHTPADGSDYRRNLRDRAGRTILHEFEHTVSPPDYEKTGSWYPNLNRFEEGIATTLAWWPGRIASVWKRAGVASPDPELAPIDAFTGYPEWHDLTKRLLMLAGIDVTAPADFAKADAMLQGRPIEQVPAALADAIAANKGLPPQRRDQLAQMISDPNATIQSLEAFAAGAS